MANSIFYNMTHGRRFPVSLLALETYAIRVTEVSTEDEHYDMFIKILTSICGVENPQVDDIQYLAERIKSIKDETVEGKASKAGHSFGTYYQEYLGKLSSDSTILRMVNYDVNAARRIYCELDRDDAYKLMKEYLEGLLEEGRLRMEAAMYGFGGGYKDDGKGGSGNVGETFDVSSEEGKAALKAMGFA